MAWLGSGVWGKRIEITVSNANIGSDLTHFPLLLTLGASVGTGADDISAIFDELTSDANRLKIAVTQADGTTEIKCEIEDWDDASESAHLWVASSGLTLSASGTTTLYIYYDSGHADNTANVGDVASAAGEAVWDADYVLVAHLSETTGTHLDSTSNDNDESAKSIANQDIAGIIDGGDNFASSHVQFTNTGMIVGQGVIQAWFKEDINPATVNEFIFSHRATGDTRVYARNNLGNLNTRYQADSRIVGDLSGGWHHVAVSWSGADWFTNLDAAAQLVDLAAGTIPAVDTHVAIGSYVDLGTGQNFDGDIDEFRVSKIQRSDDWLQADYHAGTDNLVSYGAEELEPASGDPAITDFGDEDFDDLETGAVITGTDFESPQGTGFVEISDNATYGSGNVVRQDETAWTFTSITVTIALGAMAPGTPRYLWVTNDTGNRNAVGFQCHIHRARQFVMVGSANITAGGGQNTTQQLALPDTKAGGDYDGGKITDDTNPSGTVDPTAGGFIEDEICLQATAASDYASQSQFRVLRGGVVLDSYSVDPRVTIAVTAAPQEVLHHSKLAQHSVLTGHLQG